MLSRVGRLECVVERVARAREHITHLRERLTRLITVVPGRVDVVLAERLSRVATTRIISVDDRVVLPAAHPSLQLRRANGSERVRLERGVDDLEDAVGEIALRLVGLG